MLPEQFEISIGGYMGRSYHLKWENDHLRYILMGYGFKTEQTLVIRPSAEHWEDFWKKLEKINIWSWQSEYPNPGIMDGTQWSVNIEWNEKALHTRGDNSFPDGLPGMPGSSFDQFLRAVKSLIGGLTFE